MLGKSNTLLCGPLKSTAFLELCGRISSCAGATLAVKSWTRVYQDCPRSASIPFSFTFKSRRGDIQSLTFLGFTTMATSGSATIESVLQDDLRWLFESDDNVATLHTRPQRQYSCSCRHTWCIGQWPFTAGEEETLVSSPHDRRGLLLSLFPDITPAVKKYVRSSVERRRNNILDWMIECSASVRNVRKHLLESIPGLSQAAPKLGKSCFVLYFLCQSKHTFEYRLSWKIETGIIVHELEILRFFPCVISSKINTYSTSTSSSLLTNKSKLYSCSLQTMLYSIEH